MLIKHFKFGNDQIMGNYILIAKLEEEGGKGKKKKIKKRREEDLQSIQPC